MQSLSAATPTPTPTPTATPAPTPATVGPSFTVSWTDQNAPAAKVLGYHLKYGNVSKTYTTTVDVKAPLLTKDFSAMPLGTIYLVVTAYNAIGESAPSAEVQVDILGLPIPPGTPTITNTSTADGMVNISTRAQVAEGDNRMISGFILEGERKVAIRALGPSLANAGVAGAMDETNLELHDGQGAILRSNNGWENGPDAQALRDNKLQPASSKESALIADLPPGAYTAVVNGQPLPGIGLVEVYALQ